MPSDTISTALTTQSVTDLPTTTSRAKDELCWCSIPGYSRSFGTDTDRWHATLPQSRATDCAFLHGVLTTKNYCRPSCYPRRPANKHVGFFTFPGAIESAEHAKLRPCKRCKPEALGTVDPGVAVVSEVMRKIVRETFEKQGAEVRDCLKQNALAKSAGLSAFHFYRLFKATAQTTSGDFVTACHALAL